MSATSDHGPQGLGGRSLMVLGALCLGRFCMGLQLQTVASLAPFIMPDLGFSFSDIGLLIGLFLAPGIVLAIPGSIFAARFGHVRIGVTGVVLMAAGSLGLALVGSFWESVVARLVAGTGGIMLNITFLRLAALLFEGRAMNRAIAIVMSAWPVGLGLGALAYPILAEFGGWRFPLWLVTGVTLSAALAVAVFVREPAQRGNEHASRSLLGMEGRSWRLSLILGSAFACFTAGGIVVLSFAPPFLQLSGLDFATASAVTSLLVWLGLLGTPFGGWLADRLGSARGVILAGALGSTLIILLLILGLPPLPLSMLLGILWGLPAAPFTGLLQRMLPRSDLGPGYGLYFTLFYCGFFGFPAVAGWLTDFTGSQAAPLWFAVVLLAMTAPLILFFFKLAGSGPAMAKTA